MASRMEFKQLMKTGTRARKASRSLVSGTFWRREMVVEMAGNDFSRLKGRGIDDVVMGVMTASPLSVLMAFGAGGFPSA